MTMFHELLDNPNRCEPGPLQSAARRRFPSIVQKSHLGQRDPGDAIPSSGKYAIIGIATYSPDELRLLDEVETAYPRWGTTSRVAVFDVMECKDMEDVKKHIPAFATVVQTPVVALWDGGKLVSAQTGLRMTREVLQDAGLLK
jgi:hypothetical protein